MNKVVYTTETPPWAARPVKAGQVNERTCRNCGTDERVTRRYEYHGSWWVRLECTHTQNDDEY